MADATAGVHCGAWERGSIVSRREPRRMCCKDADSGPARGPPHLGMRSAAEVVGQVRIADVPRQHHAADTKGDERERTLARPRTIQVLLEDLDQLLDDLLVGGLDQLTAALNVGGRPEQRTAAVAIVEMLAREIGVDDPLGVRLGDRTRLAPLLPSCGRFLAQKLPNGCRVELILVTKVPIEATVGEAGIAHDFVNGYPGIAVAVEKSPGAFEDFFASVPLVLR